MRSVLKLLGGVALSAMAFSVVADGLVQKAPQVKVPPVVKLQAYAFGLQDVKLLDGPFKHAMDLDQTYLLSLDPDRILHTFRLNAGIPSTAQPLGGWEEPRGELRGHFAGHYLTACALMYASTGDVRLKEKAAAVVKGMAECQAKLGNGYLSAYPESFFDRVEAQRPVWAPYYTLHKIYAGLLDVYVYCDNPEALEVCRKCGDWVIARNGRLTDEQMQKMLGNEHGGMNEALAELYALTGEKKYLTISQRFNHTAVIGPAEQRVDKLTGLHANTQIPKFVGTARQYELTGEEKLATASKFFWETVVNERSYVIGGNSDGEHFSSKERLSTALGPNTTETCNTYNMLKLTRHLFAWDPKAVYADYYERALYNHILASQNPETGMTCYYVPLRSGSRKTYNTPLNSFWCCTGTGVENHAKYGDSIYFHDGGAGLYVNLFIASELAWKDRGIKVRQETKFPDDDATTLTFACEKPTELSVRIRHPYWVRSGFEIKLNGKRANVPSEPGSYATLTRMWATGDTIQVTMPFSLRTEGFRDNPNRIAFMDGPLVLSAQVDPNKPFPAVVAEDKELLAEVKPVAGKIDTFSGPAAVFRAPGQADAGGVTLEPFFRMHGNRPYMVYFDRFTADQWRTKEAAYRAEMERRKQLEARIVDQVNPGEAQNERDHKHKGERDNSGDFSDRKYRHAANGWFSWEFKVLPDRPQELVVTYWGSDSGGRTFDILVDGQKLATQALSGKKPGEFYDEIYLLPEAMIRGKTSITVRFEAHPNNTAGGVFGLLVLRKQD